MIWIEIIGPSGVGKSYWYAKFMQEYPEYEPREMVLNRIYESEDITKQPLKIRILFWVFRRNIYKLSSHFKHKLFNYFLNRYQRKSKSIFTQKDDKIIKEYLRSVDALKKPQIVVLKKINYFHQKLLEFKFYQYYLKENDIYIAEDGLMHLSPIWIEELKADKVIISEKDFEKPVQQRLQRAQKNPTAFIEFLLSEEDLKSYIHEYYKLYDSKITSLVQHYKASDLKLINLDEMDVLKDVYGLTLAAKND